MKAIKSDHNNKKSKNYGLLSACYAVIRSFLRYCLGNVANAACSPDVIARYERIQDALHVNAISLVVITG